MTTRITGWAPDPHDAEPPEDEAPVCERCGGDAEDGVDVKLDESETLVGEVEGQSVRLCDACNDARIQDWGSGDYYDAIDDIRRAAGLVDAHPALVAKWVIEIISDPVVKARLEHMRAGGG